MYNNNNNNNKRCSCMRVIHPSVAFSCGWVAYVTPKQGIYARAARERNGPQTAMATGTTEFASCTESTQGKSSLRPARTQRYSRNVYGKSSWLIFPHSLKED